MSWNADGSSERNICPSQYPICPQEHVVYCERRMGGCRPPCRQGEGSSARQVRRAEHLLRQRHDRRKPNGVVRISRRGPPQQRHQRDFVLRFRRVPCEPGHPAWRRRGR